MVQSLPGRGTRIGDKVSIKLLKKRAVFDCRGLLCVGAPTIRRVTAHPNSVMHALAPDARGVRDSNWCLKRATEFDSGAVWRMETGRNICKTLAAFSPCDIMRKQCLVIYKCRGYQAAQGRAEAASTHADTDWAD